MNVGNIVAWIQGIIWLFALILWIGRMAQGGAKMPTWLRKSLSSNGLIGTVIILGLIATGISFYASYQSSSLDVTISAYAPVYPSPMHVIKDQMFENTDVPLDGYDYDHVTFINVCFLYDGGSYMLQNVTLKDHWKICVKRDELKNYLDLMDAFRLLDPKRQESSHTTVGRP